MMGNICSNFQHYDIPDKVSTLKFCIIQFCIVQLYLWEVYVLVCLWFFCLVVFFLVGWLVGLVWLGFFYFPFLSPSPRPPPHSFEALFFFILLAVMLKSMCRLSRFPGKGLQTCACLFGYLLMIKHW